MENRKVIMIGLLGHFHYKKKKTSCTSLVSRKSANFQNIILLKFLKFFNFQLTSAPPKYYFFDLKFRTECFYNIKINDGVSQNIWIIIFFTAILHNPSVHILIQPI